VHATGGVNRATVSWGAVSGAGSYVVTSVVNGVEGLSVATPAGVTSATVSGLAGGVPVGFVVRAANGFGSGPESAESNVVTPSGAASTYASTVLGDGPSVYYRLGEGSGVVAADSSGHGHDAGFGSEAGLGASGALVGDVNTAASLDHSGVVAQALPGDGLPVGHSPRTGEVWFNTTDTNQDFLSYGSTGEFDVYMPTSNQLEVMGHTFTTPAPVDDGAWHLVDVTYDGTLTVTLYLDGQLVGSATVKKLLNTVIDPTHGFEIGNDVDDSSHWFDGSLDEVAVYPVALSAGQVSAHFAASGE
jgi:hypothetical protein